ncbi:MAG: tetratricopeptide repeat protein [Pseudomonadota bacterium]
MTSAFLWLCAARIGAFIAVFLLNAPTHAHLPELLGREYIPEPDPPPQVEESCVDDRDELRDLIDAARRELDEAADNEDAYSVTLADGRGELAKLYRDLCNYPAALDEIRKALHAVRISDGLTSTSQLPYLRALAESYRGLGDYESAQKALRQAFRIHDLGKGELSAQALEDSLAYFQLAREVYTDPRSKASTRLFFEAFQDNKAMLESQRERALDYSNFEKIAISQLHNHYLLLGSDPDANQLGSESNSAAWDFLVRNQVLSYARGIELLEELISRASDKAPLVRARLQWRLANWHQWNVKHRRACDTYEVVWSLLQEAEDTTMIEKISAPAELPEDEQLYLHLYAADIPVKVRARASYKVSRRGDVSRLELTTIDGESNGAVGRLRRWLKDSHVRPAIVSGVCEDGEIRDRVYRLLE